MRLLRPLTRAERGQEAELKRRLDGTMTDLEREAAEKEEALRLKDQVRPRSETLRP